MSDRHTWREFSRISWKTRSGIKRKNKIQTRVVEAKKSHDNFARGTVLLTRLFFTITTSDKVKRKYENYFHPRIGNKLRYLPWGLENFFGSSANILQPGSLKQVECSPPSKNDNNYYFIIFQGQKS